jgi:hypothetical protein
LPRHWQVARIACNDQTPPDQKVSGSVMIEVLDSIGDFIEGRPWVALGWVLLCLLLLSALISLAQRRVLRKLTTDVKNKTGEDLRKRDA